MSRVRNSKTHEDMPDFDEMMNEVNEEIQEKDAEQDIISRVPELKHLSADIEKAITAVINAKLTLETSIQFTKREEGVLGAAVKTISDKVETINKHIDGVLEDAPTKLKVSVTVDDADWQKMQDLFDQEHKWVIGRMQENIRQVNAMFVEERRSVQKRYKEYDGCYLGHYAQWFFWFFFVLGFFVFTSAIVMMVGRWCHWF